MSCNGILPFSSEYNEAASISGAAFMYVKIYRASYHEGKYEIYFRCLRCS